MLYGSVFGTISYGMSTYFVPKQDLETFYVDDEYDDQNPSVLEPKVEKYQKVFGVLVVVWVQGGGVGCVAGGL